MGSSSIDELIRRVVDAAVLFDQGPPEEPLLLPPPGESVVVADDEGAFAALLDQLEELGTHPEEVVERALVSQPKQVRDVVRASLLLWTSVRSEESNDDMIELTMAGLNDAVLALLDYRALS